MSTHVQKPAEIAHVAGDVSKNGAEPNMAQQPACGNTPYDEGPFTLAQQPDPSAAAAAGGEIARLRAQVETLTRDCGRQASKIAELIADLKFQDGKHREDRAQLQTIYEHQRGECWYWQGDGQDHLESLCNTLPVVIRADQLRALVSTPPAQAADSVLEDAARLDWLEQNIFHRDMNEWDSKVGGRGGQSMWVFFAPKGVQGSARKIIDAASKQGGHK